MTLVLKIRRAAQTRLKRHDLAGEFLIVPQNHPPPARAIVERSIALGKDLRLMVLAEGVEDDRLWAPSAPPATRH